MVPSYTPKNKKLYPLPSMKKRDDEVRFRKATHTFVGKKDIEI